MTHSPKFKDLKYYYEHKLWTEGMIRNAVDKGWITSDEADEILQK